MYNITSIYMPSLKFNTKSVDIYYELLFFMNDRFNKWND